MSEVLNLEGIEGEVLSCLMDVAPLVVSAAAFYVTHDLGNAEVVGVLDNPNHYIEEKISLLNERWFVSEVSEYGDTYHCYEITAQAAATILHNIGGRELLEQHSLLSDFQKEIFIGDLHGKKIIACSKVRFGSLVWKYEVIRYHPYRKGVNPAKIIADLKESLEAQGCEVEIRGSTPSF